MRVLSPGFEYFDESNIEQDSMANKVFNRELYIVDCVAMDGTKLTCQEERVVVFDIMLRWGHGNHADDIDSIPHPPNAINNFSYCEHFSAVSAFSSILFRRSLASKENPIYIKGPTLYQIIKTRIKCATILSAEPIVRRQILKQDLPPGNWLCTDDRGTLHSRLNDLVKCGPLRVPQYYMDIIKKKMIESVEDNISNLDVNWILLRGKAASEEDTAQLLEAVYISCKEHAKTEDTHEDVGKLEKDGNKAIVMIKPLQQTNKSHEDSSGDGGTNPAGIWFN
ncbi:hypothetical protein Tco_1428735 [Tanacetum coccineum]